MQIYPCIVFDRVWSIHDGSLQNTLIHHCEAVLHLRFQDGIMVTCSKVGQMLVQVLKLSRMWHLCRRYHLVLILVQFHVHTALNLTGVCNCQLMIFDDVVFVGSIDSGMGYAVTYRHQSTQSAGRSPGRCERGGL